MIRPTRRSHQSFLAIALGVTATLGAEVRAAAEAPAAPAPAATPVPTPPATQPSRPAPKEIGEQTKKGLAWLAAAQREDGGWDQGETAKGQVRGGEPEVSNVADTCMAALAFVRAGHTPKQGEYGPKVAKAIDFVCAQVERASQDGLSITDIRTTRLQSKLGPDIDTFASALLLAEVRGQMPQGPSGNRVIAALDKVMAKIEKNQKHDGRWVDANAGWAATLCNSVANKAVNRAAQSGAAVSEKTIVLAQTGAAADFDLEAGAVKGEGSAGIELSARSANLQAFQDGDVVNQMRQTKITSKLKDAEKRLEEAQLQIAQAQQSVQQQVALAPAGAPAAAAPTTLPAQRQLAMAQAEIADYNTQIDGIASNARNLKAAQAKVVERFDDPRFVAGFGNNGGEEFLSFMNIGESLLVKGGEEFAKWDKAMTENLNRIQNADGSWSGHHCITGRTFCTAAALLTLTVDRAPVVAAAVT